MSALDSARRQHRDFFLAAVERADAATPRRFLTQVVARDDALDELDQDVENVRQAIRWSLDVGEVDEALRLVAAMTPYWVSRGQLAEAKAWFTEALADPTSATPLVRADAMHALGRVYQAGGEYQEAVECQRQAVEVARGAGDRRLLGRALMTLGYCLSFSEGSPGEADEALRESVVLFRELANPDELARALITSAICLGTVWGAEEQTRALASEARELANRVGEDLLLELLPDFIYIEEKLGTFGRWTSLTERGYQLALKSGDPDQELYWTQDLVRARFRAGELEAAADLVTAGLAKRAQPFASSALAQLGALVAISRGDLGAAEELAERALVTVREGTTREDEQATHLGALVALAEVARRQGQPDRCRQLLEHSLTVSKNPARASVLRRLGDLSVHLHGPGPEAALYLDGAVEMLAPHNDPRNQVMWYWRGLRAVAAGDTTTARQLFAEGVAATKRWKAPFSVELAKVLLAEGDAAEARKHFASALEELEPAASAVWVAAVSLGAAQACLVAGDVDDARRCLAPIAGRWRNLLLPNVLCFPDPVVEVELLEALAAVAAGGGGENEAIVPVLVRTASARRQFLMSPRRELFPLPDMEYEDAPMIDTDDAVRSVLAL